jgi:chemotaxis protein CheC
VLGEALPATEAAEMEDEALAETGNVILNSCLATMANMLERSLTMSLPEVLRHGGASLLETARPAEEEGLVLFLYINFSVQSRSIRGYIAMVMDLSSLETLKRLVGEFIDRVMQDDTD